MSIKRIHIDPAWSFHDEAGNHIDPLLFKLLQAIREHGKLTQATKAIGVSYRHGWNLLNKWASFFGTEVVSLEKGKGATLTPLGEKLVWAEQRVMARLKPQMDNLASEINIELHRALSDVAPLLRLHASHGYAVALLPDFASDYQLDLQYQSPLDALSALNRGACDIAGFHIPTGVVIPELMAAYSKLIKPQAHVAIRFISREQGLMVQAGNPQNVQGFKDLLRPQLKFINRQKDSGTRSLLDQLLKDEGIAVAGIQGYSDQEFTHGAIAAYVAAGMADVGFGVKAAAKQFGLDFIPIASEDYIMVCNRKALNDVALIRFINEIQSEAFHQAVAKLPGYKSDRCGEILSVGELLAAAS
ncbi:helix-turn-helix transcriptional regulator [Dasania sp. GY-MA-18]|uniref:Helix-turn-helix transcriptional regulator n=1 Tax=Dasania phycosphaerae TaxID=2950436 RepID=A0A9J6RLA5_9GAMM|nr:MULTISPECIES: helix-turn-helix transcriptional regulator [Dasania]MCR8922782.1 helix-turn-helix transcriptional regulator [Dasania sp. GY-MA-18]MCZ0865212.1 helix-turn-helix transcriptional regulator [Dasania phycosphaerae]MCZ0868938.1 helix-turn-helix transcriptional regulator [Dasania phycosphaerae]